MGGQFKSCEVKWKESFSSFSLPWHVDVCEIIMSLFRRAVLSMGPEIGRSHHTITVASRDLTRKEEEPFKMCDSKCDVIQFSLFIRVETVDFENEQIEVRLKSFDNYSGSFWVLSPGDNLLKMMTIIGHLTRVVLLVWVNFLKLVKSWRRSFGTR